MSTFELHLALLILCWILLFAINTVVFKINNSFATNDDAGFEPRCSLVSRKPEDAGYEIASGVITTILYELPLREI